MKINSILNKYIFFELIPPFAINLAFLSFIFLMTKILEIANLIVNYRVSLLKVVLMLTYSMPFFLEFIIPMSVMMSVLLTFLRLSGDNEILALKAGGVSIYGLLPPVFLFCMFGLVLTGFMTIYGLPWGRLSFKELAYKVARENFDIGLKERTFNTRIDGVMLYVSEVDIKKKRLIDVFIEDQRTKNIVSTAVAPEGILFSDPENLAFHLRLYNGIINKVSPETRSVHSIHFDTYDIRLDMKKDLMSAKNQPKDEEEMTLTELRAYLRNDTKKEAQYYLTLMEFHKKFSLPFSCFALGLLAVPLGMQTNRAKKSYGLVVGLMMFFLYYMMLSAGWVFGEAGVYPPLIGMWIPNVIMGSLGLFLLIKTAHEHSIRIDLWFSWASRLVSRSVRG
ncbi:MAG TPA: LPS export ABC transporter permease LptF [Desulfobacterales bacterium]|nr:LPS export ABC transporter permease LptF [Desulfobacterales bacterium]